METEQTADQEAARWLILLQEQPHDRALKAEFEAWLAASPVNAAAWAETSRIGNLIAQSQAGRRHRRAQPRPAPRGRVIVATAIALAAAAAIIIALVPSLLLRFTADYATSTAEIRSISLPDGSLITLAPESVIDVEYAAGKRGVRLLAGGAFFEVEPHTTRPFTVSAASVETTVLGTAFDVRLDGDGATVAVRHGSVRVAGSKSREELGPGSWVRMAASSASERGRESPRVPGAWMRGELVAIDRTIAEIVTVLEGYFHGAIFVADDELATQRVTGIYALNDPVQTLRAVAMTHHATLRQITPWILVLSKD